MIAQIIIIYWEIKTIQRLIKTLEIIRGEVAGQFKKIKDELQPLINALNKSTPFLEVVNSVIGIFSKKTRRKKDERPPEISHNAEN